VTSLSAGNLRERFSKPKVDRALQQMRETIGARRLMTICAAALCKSEGQDAIVGVSDRRLILGAAKLDPKHQTKGFGLSPKRFIAFSSGNIDDHFAVITPTHQELINRTDEEEAIGVKEVAGMYERNYLNHRHKKAEAKYLAPMNLDWGLFQRMISSSRTSRTAQLSELQSGVQNFKLDLASIIAGVDNGGAHIYDIDAELIATCKDAVGFSVVGSGQEPFIRRFFEEGYDRAWPMEKTILSMFWAKKEAERIVDSIGVDTDLWIMKKGGAYLVNQQLIDLLEKWHESLKKKIDEHNDALIAEIMKANLLTQA
jgi:hypothetical protein